MSTQPLLSHHDFGLLSILDALHPFQTSSNLFFCYFSTYSALRNTLMSFRLSSISRILRSILMLHGSSHSQDIFAPIYMHYTSISQSLTEQETSNRKKFGGPLD